MKKTLYTMILMISLLLAGQAAAADSVDDFEKLNSKIENATPGTPLTISLEKDIEMAGIITVKTGCAVTIEGNGKTIKRAAKYPGSFFSVSAGATLDMYRVTLDGAGVSPANIMVYVEGTLYATNANFLNNVRDTASSASNGGAINAGSGAVLALSGATFSGNKAYNGGAVYAQGAMALTIRDASVLENNQAYANGGAVYAGANFNFFSSEMKNNIAGGAGGGVYLSGGTGTLNSAALSGNRAQNGGGAALFNGAKMTLSASCAVADNQATGDGGGVYAYDSDFVLGSGQAYGNRAARGGGVWIQGSGRVLSLASGSAIRNNTATGDGGGVWLNSAQLTMISASSISNNTGVNGGGICALNGTLSMSDSAALADNRANNGGGGAWLSGGSLSLEDSAVIRDNRAEDRDNGYGGGVKLKNAAMTMINQASVSGNTGIYGAGCYCEGSASVTMKDSARISGNQSVSGVISTGGGVELQDRSSLVMEDYASIRDNKVQLGGGLYLDDYAAVSLSDGASVCGNVANRCGGVMMRVGGTLTMSDSASVEGNHANEFAGGIWTRTTPDIILSGSPRIIGNTSGSEKVSDNCYVLNQNGGSPIFKIKGALELRASIGVNFPSSITTYCVAQADGYTLVNTDAERFTYDRESKYLGIVDTKSGNTGVYFADKGHPILIYVNGVHPDGNAYWWSNLDNVFKDFVNGGSRPSGTKAFTIRLLVPLEAGSRTTYDVPGGVTVTLTGANITSNRTGNARLFTVNSGGTLILDGISIDGNGKGGETSALVDVENGGTLKMCGGATLKNSGGCGAQIAGAFNMGWGFIEGCKKRGVYIASGGVATLEDGAFVSRNSGYAGGGIYNLGTLTMNGGTVSKNTATGSGGGVYNTGTFGIKGGCTIWNNEAAQDGGGVYSTGSMTADGAASVNGNTAGRNGGGIACRESGTLTVTGAVHINNNSAANGGGLYLGGTSCELGEKTQVYYNSVTGDGGGVYVAGGTPTIDGSVYQNTATGDGGGLYLNGTAHTLAADVYGNSAASGGGLYVGSGTLTASGSVYNNTAARDGGGLYLNGATHTVESPADVYGNSAANGGGAYLNAGTLTLTDNIKLHDNSAAEKGGGLYAVGTATITKNAALTGNRAKVGSGLYATGAITMAVNASVTGNTASDKGGVYLENSASLSLSGLLDIWGNLTDTGAASNIYLPKNKTVTLEDDTSGQICLSPEVLPTNENSTLTVATFLRGDNISLDAFKLDGTDAGGYYFTKDDSSQTVSLKKITPQSADDKVASDVGGIITYHTSFSGAADNAFLRMTTMHVTKATLTLLADAEITKTAEIPKLTELTVVGNGHTLSRNASFNSNMFYAENANKLCLNNITLSGAGAAAAVALVKISNTDSAYDDTNFPITLTMLGTKLTGNTGTALELAGGAKAQLGADTEITGNGQGVEGKGTLYLSDNVRITGNAENGVKKNVFVTDMTYVNWTGGQHVVLTGELTDNGQIGVQWFGTDVSSSSHSIATGSTGGYTPQSFDANHFAWDGEANSRSFMCKTNSNKKVEIVFGASQIDVDGLHFSALYDAFEYVNTAGRYENGREATITLQGGKPVYLEHSNVPKLNAGRKAVLTSEGTAQTIKRFSSYLAASNYTQNMIEVSGTLTLKDCAVDNYQDTTAYTIQGPLSPAIAVKESGRLIMQDKARVVKNDQNTPPSDDVHNQGFMTMLGDACVTGILKNDGDLTMGGKAHVDAVTGAGALSVSGNVTVPSVSLAAGKVIRVTGELGADAKIGISLTAAPVSGSPVMIARSDNAVYPNGLTVEDAGRFESANPPLTPPPITLYDAADGAALLGFTEDRFAVSPSNIDFTLFYGEQPKETRAFTVINRSLTTQNLTYSMSPNPPFDIITDLPDQLAAGASAPLTLQPKANWPMGKHSISVCVSMFSSNRYGLASVSVELPFGIDDLDSISVRDQPDKMVYRPGEALDLTGMTITLTGTNGRSVTAPYPLTGLSGFSHAASPAQGTVLRLQDNGTPVTVTVSRSGKDFTAQTDKLTVSQSIDAYPVTVNGGRGGGSYPSGATVALTADEPAEGMRFAGWRVVSGGAELSDPSKSQTAFVMPARAVEVTAEFERSYTPVTGIDMIEARTMTAGESAYPAAKLTPEDARLRDLIWTSSDETVAAVAKNGLVRALKPGTAIITGTSRSAADVSASCAVTVVPPETEPEGAKARALTLVKGKKLNLAKRYGAFYAWESSDPAVASVGKKGVLKAKKPGVVTVRGTLGKARAKSALVGDEIVLRVTVVKKGAQKPEAPALAVTPDVRTQKVGEAASLSVQTTPANADLSGLTWESADPAVATVDENGLVTGVSAGETTVTATLGAWTASARIVVEEETAGDALTLFVDFLAVAKDTKIKLNELTGFKGTWSADDPAIATVGKSGLLKTKKTGRTALTFTVAKAAAKGASFMGKSLLAGDSVRVTLAVTGAKKAVTKVKVRGEKRMAVGGTQALNAAVKPKDAKYPQVYWRSDHPSVASVDAEGNVLALSPGKATITVTATSAATDTIAITVTQD